MARWGLSGGLAALRGRAFFIFQFAPGAKGLGFVSGFLLQWKAVRVGGWPRGDFALCGGRPGLCPWIPRFFEKNRVKLFFLGNPRKTEIFSTNRAASHRQGSGVFFGYEKSA